MNNPCSLQHRVNDFRLGFVAAAFLFLFSFTSAVHAQSIKDLFDQAAQAFYGGDYDTAIKNYEKIIELEPNFAPAYNALGLALKIRGAADEDVIFYFKKAMAIDPNLLPSYDNLGKLYYSNGDMDHAQEYFEKGLAIDPENESLTLSMGWIYLLGRNNPDEAIKYFRKIVAKNESAMGYFGEGIGLMTKQKRMEVMEIVTKLRGISQEGLAQDLETMLRENRSLIRSELPEPGRIKTTANPTESPSGKKALSLSGSSARNSSSGDSSHGSFTEYDENGELRVRLLDKLPE